MRLRTTLLLALAVALIGLPVGGVLAQEDTTPPQIIFTNRYRLEEGSVVDGSLIVVAQIITLAAGSRVTGDAALIGSAIVVEGQIDGELTALGESVLLANSAAVAGNVYLCADSIDRQPFATLSREYAPGCEEIGGLLERAVPAAFDPSNWQWEEGQFDLAAWRDRLGMPEPSVFSSPGQRLLAAGVFALLAGAVSALVTLIVPLRLRRVSDAALAAPLVTAGIGLLSVVVAAGVTGLVIVSLVLMVTVCLLPLVGLGWVILALMLMLGWAAVSLPFGAWLLLRLGMRRVSPAAAAAVGAVLVAAVTGLLAISVWTLPLYVLAISLLGSWGLGAVVLTRFGGQTYPNPHPHTATPSAAELDEAPFKA